MEAHLLSIVDPNICKALGSYSNQIFLFFR